MIDDYVAAPVVPATLPMNSCCFTIGMPSPLPAIAAPQYPCICLDTAGRAAAAVAAV
jgi:hypothetical protein